MTITCERHSMDPCFDWPNAWVNHSLTYYTIIIIILWLCLKCFIFVAMIRWSLHSFKVLHNKWCSHHYVYIMWKETMKKNLMNQKTKDVLFFSNFSSMKSSSDLLFASFQLYPNLSALFKSTLHSQRDCMTSSGVLETKGGSHLVLGTLVSSPLTPG
jgi:hypothetical protein